MSHGLSLEFPLEIVELIFDNLVDDDDKNAGVLALKNCSLACQSMLPICRKRIYASINVSKFKTMENLAALLRAAPEIAGYTKSLTLHLGFLPLPAELKMFSKLQSYHLSFDPKYSLDPTVSHFDFKKIGPQMRQILLHPLPTLKYLELSRITNFPFYDLMPSFPTVSQLDPMFTDITEIYIPSVASPLQPDALGITAKVFRGKQEDGQRVIDFSTVKYLHLGFHVGKPGRKPRLVTFFLVAGAGFHSKGLAAFLLPSFEDLEEIDIRTEIGEPDQDPLSGLCTELKILREHNSSLDTLTLEIRILSECTTGNEWGKLDQIVEYLKPAWPGLQTINLRLFLDINRPDEDIVDFRSRLEALPETQFPYMKRNIGFHFGVDKLIRKFGYSESDDE